LPSKAVEEPRICPSRDALNSARYNVIEFAGKFVDEGKSSIVLRA
jgi:hypothetical protein